MNIDLYKEIDALDDTRLLFHNIDNTAICTINIKNRYAIFINNAVCKSKVKERVALAHEMGHVQTGSTHKVYSPFDIIERHEYRANKWAVHRLIPFEQLKSAIIDKNLTEAWELAEHFDVTEDFMRTAIYVYQCEGLIPIKERR